MILLYFRRVTVLVLPESPYVRRHQSWNSLNISASNTTGLRLLLGASTHAFFVAIAPSLPLPWLNPIKQARLIKERLERAGFPPLVLVAVRDSPCGFWDATSLLFPRESDPDSSTPVCRAVLSRAAAVKMSLPHIIGGGAERGAVLSAERVISHLCVNGLRWREGWGGELQSLKKQKSRTHKSVETPGAFSSYRPTF